MSEPTTAYRDLTQTISAGLSSLRASTPEEVKNFSELGRAATASGVLDAKTKELVYLAVSIAHGCEYCVHSHTAAARAKGMTEGVVLFRHVLRNALIPIVTSAGAYLPYVFMGSLVFESFFGIPGLGAFVIEAISGQDFAIVRTMVFLGSLLYIASFAVIDIAYTWVDPRVRLS